ncbi:hypothetical protein [Winogradskya consettensis]|nr:hypothetical protein [Actinoplanes consettensis]
MLISQILDHPALKVVRDAAATIRAVGLLGSPVVGAIAVAYITWGRRGVRPDLAISIIAGLLAAAMLLAWGLRNSAAIRAENAFIVDSMQSMLFVEIEGNHHRYTRSREQIIRCNQSIGARLIPQGWYWTGQSSRPYEIRSIFPGQVIFDGARAEQDHWIYHWIYLGRRITMGEVVHVGTIVTVEDDVLPMREFYAERASGFRMRNLKVVLRFPRSEEPKKVEACKWPGVVSSRGAEILPSVRTVNNDGTVDFVIVANSPKRRSRYGFRWE